MTILMSNNTFIIQIILALSLLMLPIACAKGLDTDEAVAEAFAKVHGKPVDKDGLCIARPKSFKNLIALGIFVNDRGCLPRGYFVSGAWIDKPDAAAKVVLADAGWDTASPETRQALATDWFNQVIFAFDGTPVQSATKAFKVNKTPFIAPNTTTNHEGTITVSAWIRQPSGMVWEETYYQYTVTFSPDRTVIGQASDKFSVPGEMLKALKE